MLSRINAQFLKKIGKKLSRSILFYVFIVTLIIFGFLYNKRLLIIIILILFVISTILLIFLFKNDVKNKIKDKEFLLQIFIEVIIFGIIIFFLTSFINIVILSPLFSPKISLDTTCNYRSPLGQYDILLENKGQVGEEGFAMIIKNIILTNFTSYAVSNVNGNVIEFIYKKNLPAYEFSEEWAKNNCFIEHNYPILERDTREGVNSTPLPNVENKFIKIYCEYFPPQSKTKINLNSLKLDKNLVYIYWGKDTKVTEATIRCKPPVCISPLKDFLLNIYFKLTNRYQFKDCSGKFSKYFGRELKVN